MSYGVARPVKTSAAWLPAIMLAVVGGIAGCSNASSPSSQLTSASLSASLSSDIRSTEPGVNRDANTDTVMAHIFEGLVAYDENGHPRPMLANTIDVSPDGLQYRFNLRHDVHFQNGEPLTSKEVLWSWRRYLEPDTRWTCLRDFDGSGGGKILSIEADGQHAVVFTLGSPQPLFLSQMASLQCGQSAIVHPSSVNVDGSWRAPVATGPYKLEKWVRGEYLELRAFKGYARRSGPRDGLGGGKDALAPMIRWMIIRDGTARLAALLKGQIDVMPESTGAELRQLRRYKELQIDTAPGAVVSAILIQPSQWPLSDVRFRKALALSIDRQVIAELATGGTGSSNASLVPVSSPNYSQSHRQGQATDIVEAKRLLNTMGYKGERIALVTNRRYADMFDQALLVQAMARKAGINIDLKVSEWASQLDSYSTGKFELMSFAYSARADPALTFESVIGDRSKNARKQWGSASGLALLKNAQAAASLNSHQQALDQLHELMLKEVPLIVLFNPADNNAIRADIRGFKSWSLGRARLWGVSRKAGRS